MKAYKYFPLLLIAVTVSLLGFFVVRSNSQNQPAVVSAVAPVYPAVAIALKLDGDYYVDVEINKEGKVTSSKAVEGTHKMLRKVIEEAADRWRFSPDADGEKKRRAKLTFSFHYTPQASNLDSTTVFYPPYRIEVRENTVLETTPSS